MNDDDERDETCMAWYSYGRSIEDRYAYIDLLDGCGPVRLAMAAVSGPQLFEASLRGVVEPGDVSGLLARLEAICSIDGAAGRRFVVQEQGFLCGVLCAEMIIFYLQITRSTPCYGTSIRSCHRAQHL